MEERKSDKDRFLAYVKNYTPEVQIMRFFYLIQAKKELSLVLVEGFLQLALDNKLIGCYKSIVKRSGIEEPSRYIEARNIQQEAVAKTVVDLKKNIVSITERKPIGKQLSMAHLQLANILVGFGEYDEADEQLRRIKDLNELEADQYYPLWVRINMLGMKIEQSRNLAIKLTETNQNNSEIRKFLIAQDLREVAEGKQVILNNITGLGLKSSQLRNQYITEVELGEYYSLLTLASGKRELSKKYMAWSSFLEKSHVRMQYRKLLEETKNMLDRYEFDPWLGRRSKEIHDKIRSNMFMEVIRAFKVAKLELIEKELGMSEKEVQKCLNLNQNAEWRYLLDPITRTVHLAEKNNRLLMNLEGINKLLRTRQDAVLREKEDDRFRLGALGAFSGLDDDDRFDSFVGHGTFMH